MKWDKKAIIHLLKVEEQRQGILHKLFRPNCKYCKELRELLKGVDEK